MALSVAVQVYSVRDDAKADLRGTLEKIKKMGYDGVEFAGLYGYEPAEVKKMCEEIGLVPVSAHVAYYDLLEDAEGLFEKYAAVGCKYVAIPYLNTALRPETDRFPEVIENIKILGQKANEKGIQLLYHNHDFEFVIVNGKYGLDMLYDEVPAELLGTEIDTCWVNIGGENPADYLRKYAGRTKVVHLKDFVGTKSENMYELIGIENAAAPERPSDFDFRPVGSGVQNFPEILKACEDIEADWVVVEMDKPCLDYTPMDCIEKSIQYLKSIGY